MNIVLQSIRTAFSSLWSKKIRSLLTMLGVIIGVSQIIVLIGLGQGVKQDVRSEVTQLGSNLLIVLPGKVQSGSGYNPTASLGASTLTDSDIIALRALPDISELTPLSLIGGVPSVGDKTSQGGLILAVEPSYFDLLNTSKLIAGRELTQDDLTSQANVMVIDQTPRQTLFPGISAEDTLGKSVKLGKQQYTVVGVTEAPSSTSAFGGNTFSNTIVIPYSTARTENDNAQIFRIALKTKDGPAVKTVAAEVKSAMLGQHGGTEDFTVFTQDDILGVIDSVLSLITKAIVGLSSISLLVGGIGIMNIMLVAVTERTKEIGLRKALGATKAAILTQFLTEAIILSLFGGAIGVGIATAVSIVVKAKANLSIIVDWNSILIATLFSLGVGVAFGFLPAFRAARKDPIEALRYE